MKANSARNVFSLGLLASALAACGGGGGSESAACQGSVNNLNPAFCAALPDQTAPQAAAPLTVKPSALTIGNCTTRIPFIFAGGVAPYTIFTSDNFYVPVSAALPLDDTRFYFFADVKYPVGRPQTIATVTVLDTQSATDVATITTPATFDACPSNPLLKIFPESANFRTADILAFQVSGGPAPAATPAVTFADAGVAEVWTASATTIEVRAVATVKATTLMTIATTDGQRASVVINVLPPP